ncbi:MAG TPA: hypothetical protein VFY10_05870 [Dehalococcoidia bacterium]|nr:hypothetical protein [Dehalococcoidia bacterium]
MRQRSLAIDKYLEFLGRRKWFLIVPLVIGILASIAASSWLPQIKSQEYQSKATMRLALAGGSESGLPRMDVTEVERITNTSIYLLQSSPTLAAINTNYNLHLTTAEMKSRFTITALPNTELIQVVAKGPSPAEAQALANALANAWPQINSDYYVSIKRPDLAASFTLLEPATQPGSAIVSTGWPQRAGIGILLGLAVGLGLALFSEYTDGTLNTVEDVSAATDVPILGCLPRLTHLHFRRRSPHQAREDFDPQRLGEMRLLTVKLARMAREKHLHSILFTGVWPKAGTTGIAIGAGRGLASNEFEVLLVDASLAEPGLQRAFDVPRNQPGLTDVLVSASTGGDFGVAIDKAAVQAPTPGMRVLGSGTPAPDSWNLLGSYEMRRLVQVHEGDASGEPQLMVIDGPSLFSSADALALASVVDGVVVVCSEGKTTGDDLQRSLSQLDSLGANVLGIVYNRAKAASRLPQTAPTLIMSGDRFHVFGREEAHR